MKPASELQIGDIIGSPLYEHTGKSNELVREKKGRARRVTLVVPRTDPNRVALTHVRTSDKDKPNVRSVWELSSDLPLEVTR